MPDPQYIYGLTTHGIQSYIFQTNKLSQIIGGSELIESVCTKFFNDFVADIAGDVLLQAAGNIRYRVFGKEDAQKMLGFGAKIQEELPGVEFTQHILSVNNPDSTEQVYTKLNLKLAQSRNSPQCTPDLKSMIRLRVPKSGNAAFSEWHWGKDNKSEWFDATMLKKEESIREVTKQGMNQYCEKTQLGNKTSLEQGNKLMSNKFEPFNGLKYPYEFNELISQGEKSWMALIHADGNNMGKLFAETLSKTNGLEKNFELSKTVESATIWAYYEALEVVLKKWRPDLDKVNDENDSTNFLPLRPLILGGDDLTVLIRADLAIEFTDTFLFSFECKVNADLKNLDIEPENRITASAGIVFLKEKFPFHYAGDLAESLCAYTKKKTERKVSSFQFHVVRDSFIEEYEEVIEREMKVDDSYSFEYGPYTVGESSEAKITSRQLISDLAILQEKSSHPNQIREWIGLKLASSTRASDVLNRLKNKSKETKSDEQSLLENRPKSLLMTMSLYGISNSTNR